MRTSRARFLRGVVYIALSITALVSCAHAWPGPQDDWEPELYFRHAQDAFDRGAYQKSLSYYELAIERFSDRRGKVAEAIYEEGFIYYKLKDFKRSKEKLDETIALFDANSGDLEPWVYLAAKQLAEKVQKELDGVRKPFIF